MIDIDGLAPCDPRYGARRAVRVALLLATTALNSPALILPASAQNLPAGGSVAAGTVAISQPSATQMNIIQSSQNAVVNWQGFSVGQGASVNFAQPNVSSAILNRVTGSTPSSIAGSITANGQVYLVNPNGIAITRSGTVNVGGGFVASTLGISDADFMNGNRTFTGNGASARVHNGGTITVGRGGYAALIGGTVSNSGAISVPLGKVALGSGEKATLDFSGDGFLQVAMPTAAGGHGALIRNSGSIKANGGSVVISAATAREAARNAINISGVVQARSISGHNGAIMIGGGAGGGVKITGRLIATSRHYAGGSITVTGKDIKLKGASVDASGATGGGTVNIGGGRQGTGPLLHADTVTIDAASTIRADATQSGNGGNVVVWSDLLTTFAGTISARGGAVSGNGGEAEVSGQARLDYTGFTNLSAANGSFGNLLLDPYDVTISGGGDYNQSGFTSNGIGSTINVATLASALGGANVTVATGGGGSDPGDITVASAVNWATGSTLTLNAYRNITFSSGGAITSSNGGHVVLRADSTGAGTGTVSFAGGVQVSTSGSVDIFYNPSSYAAPTSYGSHVGGGATLTAYMLVNNVSQLQAVENNLTGTYALGKDIDASATVGWSCNGVGNCNGFTPIDRFNGTFDGQGHVISNLMEEWDGGGANGAFRSVGLFSDIGGTVRNLGLLGGSIVGITIAGGLAAQNHGTITNSFSTASVNGHDSAGGLVADNYGTINGGSYAAANVNADTAGGLVGRNYGSITDSYADSYTNAGSTAGGLVGVNGMSGTITRTYALGTVSGAGNSGGLVGENQWGTGGSSPVSGLIQDSYAAAHIARGSHEGGLVGKNDYSDNDTQDSFNAQYNMSARVLNSVFDADKAGINYAFGYSFWDHNGFGGLSDNTLQNIGLITSSGVTPSNSHMQVVGDPYSIQSYHYFYFDDNATHWVLLPGTTRPFLTAEYSTNIQNLHQLELVGMNPTASYTLARNLDAAPEQSSGMWRPTPDQPSGAFTPIAYGGPFSGTFDGQRHTISNLRVDSGRGFFTQTGQPSYNAGLFDVIAPSGLVENLGIVNSQFNGLNGAAGSIAGVNNGTITGSWATSSIGSYGLPDVYGYTSAGGLVGSNTGLIQTSYANVVVIGSESLFGYGKFGDADGGLVGANTGHIRNAYATGNTYGTGYVGGLVGQNSGDIAQTYATGQVFQYASFAYNNFVAGPLVGTNSGAVTGSFWDSSVSRVGSNGAGTGLSTAAMQDLNSFNSTYGWDFQNVWVPPNNASQADGVARYPTLYASQNVVVFKSDDFSQWYGRSIPTLHTDLYSLADLQRIATYSTGPVNTGLSAASPVGTYAIVSGTNHVTMLDGSTPRTLLLPGTATIIPRPLTIAADNISKTYGDTLSSSFGFNVSGLVNSDSVSSVTVSGSGTDAGAPVNGGPYSITPSNAQGTGLGNYIITYQSGTLTINPATLTYTANPSGATYGSAPPALSGSVSGFVNGETAGSATQGAATFATTATSLSDVGGYAITGSGLTANNGNYIFQQAPGNSTAFSITPAQITVAALSGNSTYGSSPANPGLSASGLQNGQSVSVLSGLSNSFGITAQTDAGSATLTVAGALTNGNYTVIGTTNGSWTVNPAQITVTAASGTSIYGSSPSNPGLSATGLQNGQDASALTGLSNSFGISNLTNVGGYTLQVAGALTNTNYVVTGTTNGAWTVNPAQIVVTAVSGNSSYGSSPANPGLSASGLQNGQNASVLGGLSNSFGISNLTGAGSYTLQVAGALTNSNYTVTGTVNGAWTVNPAQIVVTAVSGNSTYGSSPANPGLSATGLQNGQNVAMLTGLSNSFGITNQTNAGNYALSVAGALTNTNYTVTGTTAGNWAVNAAPVTVTALSGSSTYGSSPLNPGLSANGLQNGQGVGALTGLANSFGITNQTNAGSTTLTVAGSLTNANYVVTGTTNGAWTVNPKSIMVTALGGSSTYGDAPSNPGLSASGLENGQNVGVLTGLANSFGINPRSNAGNHTLTVAGALTNANYSVAGTIDGGWQVNPKQIVVTALSGRSTYGSSPLNPGLSATGLQNGQDVGALTGLTNSFGITSFTNAGGYVLGVTGKLTNGNYDVIGTTNGAWTVNPAAVTVTAIGGISQQGESPANPGLTATKLQNGESVAVLTGLSNSFGIDSTSSFGNSPYSLNVVGTLRNPNYVVTARNSGIWTITPPPAIPLTLATVPYQAPRTSNVNFVQAQNPPGALLALARPGPSTRTAASTVTDTSKQAAATGDDITGSVDNRPRDVVYLPISQYDAAQYSDGKLPDYADRAGLATILTMIDRAVSHNQAATIDHLFDPAKGADWRGVGWQNPLIDKVTFAPSQPSEPVANNALQLDGSTDMTALLERGPVILAGAGGTAWLLATVRSEDGILANDPITGLHVLLSYDPATRSLGPVSRILDPAGDKWIALGDIVEAGIKNGTTAIDEAKVAALNAFIAERYLTVAVAR